MAGSITDFSFGEDLGVILSLAESDSFDESSENASVVTKKSFEIQSEELKAHSCAECLKTFKASRGLQSYFSSKQDEGDLHAFDYGVVLTKSKLKDLIQLSTKKNQIIKFSRDSSFYVTQNPHTIKRTKIVLSEASLQHNLSCKYGRRYLF